MTKRLLVILSITISLISFTQTSIKINDKETNQPIPFVHVKPVGKDTAFLSSFNGIIVLDSSYQAGDSVVLSCIGYNDKIVVLNDDLQELRLSLVKSAFLLKDVTVTGKKIKYGHTKLGVTRKPPKNPFFHHYYGRTGELRASWIPNSKSLKGTIENLNIYVTDMGFPNAYFRVHIYECSPVSVKPGKEMINKNIVVNGSTGNEWVSVDLSSMRLRIPENGFFVGIEWFSADTSTNFSDTIVYNTSTDPLKIVHKGNGAVLGTVSEKYIYSKNKGWALQPSGEWESSSKVNEERFNVPYKMNNGKMNSYNEKTLYLNVPCINADIKYVKDKEDMAFKDPKKRKLNRIDHVKQDLFKYPQNSIDALFASLIKGFENNEIIYILKYLCVFKEDEFDHLLEDLKSDAGEELVSLKEREEIIETLKKARENLNTENLEKIREFCYQIKINGDDYSLTYKNGLWKINPYSKTVVTKTSTG